MSRIGKTPIKLPEGVKAIVEGKTVSITGPLGESQLTCPSQLTVSVKDEYLTVDIEKGDNPKINALWGTTRAALANIITGVTKGFSKTLKLVGTGFRAKTEGANLVLSLGFSHPVIFKPNPGIKIETPDQETIIISGLDKSAVGQTAAKIRDIKPPEPYKGKGIRYLNETVRKKAGKVGKTGAAGFGGSA